VIQRGYEFQMMNVTFPDSLTSLFLGPQDTLQHITLPSHLKELTITSITALLTLNSIITPHTLKKIIYHVAVTETDDEISVRGNTFYIQVPYSITCIGLYNLSLMKHMHFKTPIKKLDYLGCNVESLDDLPLTLEKLIIYVNTATHHITNLPPSLKKIKIIGKFVTNTYNKITKVPYGCVIVNEDNEIITSEFLEKIEMYDIL